MGFQIFSGDHMAIPIQDIDFTTLSPAEMMQLAEMLYARAIHDSELSAPLSPDQMREIQRRSMAADRGEIVAEPWEEALKRIEQQL